jgi:hypothetical protein
MSEQQILAELSVDNIRKHVRHIVDNLPSRLAGTPNAAHMAEYSAAELRANGADRGHSGPRQLPARGRAHDPIP